MPADRRKQCGHRGRDAIADSDEECGQSSWTPGGSEKSPTKATWEIDMNLSTPPRLVTPPPLLQMPVVQFGTPTCAVTPVPQWMVEEAACNTPPTMSSNAIAADHHPNTALGPVPSFCDPDKDIDAKDKDLGTELAGTLNLNMLDLESMQPVNTNANLNPVQERPPANANAIAAAAALGGKLNPNPRGFIQSGHCSTGVRGAGAEAVIVPVAPVEPSSGTPQSLGPSTPVECGQARPQPQNQNQSQSQSQNQTPREDEAPKSEMDVLLEDEVIARSHIASQVTARRRFMHSLVLEATTLEMLKALLPDTLWSNDYPRLALMMAIMRGNLDIVSHIMTTAFSGYHTFSVQNCYLPDQLYPELGVWPPKAKTFIQLAVEAIVVCVQESERQKQDRLEIFKLLVTSEDACAQEGDAAAVEAALAETGSPVLNFWAREVPNLSCGKRACSRFCDRTIVWSEATHHMFGVHFRDRVRAFVGSSETKGLTRSNVQSVLEYMDYRNTSRLRDEADPLRITVRDYSTVTGTIETFDASQQTLAKFSQYCTGGVTPHAGMRVAVTVADCKGTQCTTGSLTGCLGDTLCWRPLGTLGSEPLPPVFLLNPLANQGDSKPRGDNWLCGMCMKLNSVRIEKCRRCYNTHQGALALESQRKRQHAAQPQPQTKQRGLKVHHQQACGPSFQYHNVGIGSGGYQWHDGLVKPYTALNLSAVPPRHDTFETADHKLAAFGVKSGDYICINNTPGIVVGIGKDDAIYWMIEGGPPGATRLALTPEALVCLL